MAEKEKDTVDEALKEALLKANFNMELDKSEREFEETRALREKTIRMTLRDLQLFYKTALDMGFSQEVVDELTVHRHNQRESENAMSEITKMIGTLKGLMKGHEERGGGV